MAECDAWAAANMTKAFWTELCYCTAAAAVCPALADNIYGYSYTKHMNIIQQCFTTARMKMLIFALCLKVCSVCSLLRESTMVP